MLAITYIDFADTDAEKHVIINVTTKNRDLNFLDMDMVLPLFYAQVLIMLYMGNFRIKLIIK